MALMVVIKDIKLTKLQAKYLGVSQTNEIMANNLLLVRNGYVLKCWKRSFKTKVRVLVDDSRCIFLLEGVGERRV